MAGGVRKVVTLRTPDYSFDPKELENAIGPALRQSLNSPHNPTGKDAQRRTSIYRLLCNERLLAICDEVYEHLIFEGEHTINPILECATAYKSHLRERHLVSLMEKIGWVCAQPALLETVRTAGNF